MNGVEDLLGIVDNNDSDTVRTEDYNEIIPSVLNSFPEGKLPIDLFCWKDSIQALSPVYFSGQNINDAMRQKLVQLSEEGMLFFSRDQIVQYMSYAGNNLDAVMQDPNLTWNEIVGLLVNKLWETQKVLFENPLPQNLSCLIDTVGMVCSFLVDDFSHLSQLIGYVHQDMIDERRRLNASLIALVVYIELNRESLHPDELKMIGVGFLLYDIGMVRTPSMTLAKPQQLGTIDRREMREHPLKGVAVLKKLGLTAREVTEAALQHHERMDGSGYPNKLEGDNIGELGRICGVADSYCAMVTPSQRRKPKTSIEATAELIRCARKYDQSACQALVRLLKSVRK